MKAITQLLALLAKAKAQYKYTTQSGSITITRYIGAGGDVIIPRKIRGMPVTSIGGRGFRCRHDLASVTIPKGVTRIGKSAFGNCTSLNSIYFMGNAPVLGEEVFNHDSKATVYHLPNATGWGTTFGGRPTAIWNPQGQTNAAPVTGGLR